MAGGELQLVPSGVLRIPGGGAFFVGGEEGGFVEARPELRWPASGRTRSEARAHSGGTDGACLHGPDQISKRTGHRVQIRFAPDTVPPKRPVVPEHYCLTTASQI